MNTFNLVMVVFATVLLFLHGLQGFSKELQAVGQDRLQAWLGRLTRNRFAGFGLGAAFTALVQSSSAVTALAVSLVDAGVISFANSLGVLIGANVGTTATAWLVSLKLTAIGPVFIVLGTLIGFMPGPLKVAGKSVFYFGLIFFALDLISDSLEPISDSEQMLAWLALAATPVLGALIGAALTALVQSSSVVTGLAILLVQQGVLPIEGAIAIIIGANAGTTVTGLLASIPMRPAARRTALANLVLNVGGVLLFLPFTHQLAALVSGLADSPGIAVALAHLIFNVGVAAVALPLVGPLARWLAPPVAPRAPEPMGHHRGPVFRSEERDEYLFPEGCYILEMLNDGAADREASIARARVSPGVTTRWHRVLETAERYVIQAGEGEVWVGEHEPRLVGPGDVVLIPPGVRQRIRNAGDADLVFLAICTPRFREENYLDDEDDPVPTSA